MNFQSLQGFAPISREMSLEECQISCHELPPCQFWSYNQPGKKCYLKSKKEAIDSTANALSLGFVSGVKTCPFDSSRNVVNKDIQIQIGGQEMLFLPAVFGQQIHATYKVHYSPHHFIVTSALSKNLRRIFLRI